MVERATTSEPVRFECPSIVIDCNSPMGNAFGIMGQVNRTCRELGQPGVGREIVAEMQSARRYDELVSIAEDRMGFRFENKPGQG